MCALLCQELLGSFEQMPVFYWYAGSLKRSRWPSLRHLDSCRQLCFASAVCTGWILCDFFPLKNSCVGELFTYWPLPCLSLVGWIYELEQRLQVTAFSAEVLGSQASYKRESMQGFCLAGYEKVTGLLPERQGSKWLLSVLFWYLTKGWCSVFCMYRTLELTAATVKQLVTKWLSQC